MLRPSLRVWRLALVSVAVTALTVSAAPPASEATNLQQSWPMAGGNILNSRSNLLESAISPANAGRLKVKWTFTTHGDVSSTPAVVGAAVYLTDWGGYLTKLNAGTGAVIWQHQVSEYDGIAGSVSRSGPAYSDGVIYIATTAGANLIAVDASTGQKKWIQNVDSHPSAGLTQSPVVSEGVVYQGASSGEVFAAADPNYDCCTFRGSLSAFDAKTGTRLWKTYTVPDNGGKGGAYSGGGVWGGTPAIDPVHHLAFITTGQNYSVPQSVEDCQTNGGTTAQCFDPNNHINSFLALDTRTGQIKWATGAAEFDTWNVACFIGGPPPNNCPDNPGNDYDFGDGPHVTVIIGADGKPREVVGGGSKSGQFWLLDALTGKIVWQDSLGPGSQSGGIFWGSSTDGHRIYIAEANNAHLPYQLIDGTTTTKASFAAIDPPTGKVLWQRTDPSDGSLWAPLTSANGVLYGSSTTGHMFAMNAATGAVLFDFAGPYASNAGPAVVAGTVYWGNGYVNQLTGSRTTGTFYAFSVDGH